MQSSEMLSANRNPWFSRLIAIIALLNLFLVFFDLSYVPWHDLYLQHLPSLTQLYNPVKGIKPHRETQSYLHQVSQLEAEVSRTGLQSAETESELARLRLLSDDMITDNPFAGANKSGTLEKIKNLIRDSALRFIPLGYRMGKESAHQAFELFWSASYLTQAGWQPEIKFFQTQIQPLIETNYYRRLGINGKSFNVFWLIDLPFVTLFGLDFLGRTYYISRQQLGLTWQQAMVRRGYDIILLLPFWRWLRIIPVLVRLNQANLLDIELVRKQINRDFVANIAEEVTEIVAIRFISQAQGAIQRGEIINWFLRPETRHRYIDVNSTNEVKAIATRILSLIVYQVVPKIQPDLETLLHYIIKSILNQSPVYQQLQKMPGVNELPTQLIQKLATDVSQTAYATLITLLEDPEVAAMSDHLFQNFGEVLEGEIQKKQNIQEIRSLLVALLEEIKINYVKGMADTAVESSLAEVTQIRQIISM